MGIVIPFVRRSLANNPQRAMLPAVKVGVQMERKDVLLAALAATSRPFYPVHLQKAMFLAEKKLAHLFSSHYHFTPYDYGPFDSAVYSDADQLKMLGLVDVSKEPGDTVRMYKTTADGAVAGAKLLSEMTPGDSEIVKKISDVITSLSFGDLVRAVYKSYPEMKVNSVFQDK